MATHSLDAEFSKYWTQLTPTQKQSLIGVIKTFFAQESYTSIEEYNQELKEAEAEYKVPWEIFKPLSKKQKKMLIAFFQAAGIEPAGRISIEQYNKEIDEAMARMDAGEGIPHEVVVEMSKIWVSGK